MSKGELARGVTISAIIAIVFGVIGYCVISIALQMVGIFGESLGIDARSRAIYAASHQWVHLFAAACGLAIGWFYRQRNWVLLTLVIVGVVGCGAYGVINMYGFGSGNRTAVAAAKESAKAAAERQYQAAREAIDSQIKWYEGQIVQEDRRREKVRMEAKVEALRKEKAALQPPVATAENVLSDAGATPLGELTPISERTWLIGLPLLLAVFMFFAESLSFVIVGHALAAIVALFAAYLEARRISKGPVNTQSGSGGSSGGAEPKRRLELVNTTTSPAATTKVSSADASVPAGAPPMSAVNIHGTGEYPRRKLTKREAQADLHSRHAASSVLPTQEYLAEQWGVSQATVSRWQAEWEQKRAKGLARVFRRNMHNGGFANAGFTAGRA